MRIKKRKLHKSFDPEKYKMVFCPSCKGTGKSSDEDGEVKVCNQCGGFKWVKKEAPSNDCLANREIDTLKYRLT